MTISRHVRRSLALVPVPSRTVWHDARSQRSIFALKIIWLVFMGASLYLMIHQIYDTTQAYLSGTKVLSTSLTNVSVTEPIWICFRYRLLNNSVEPERRVLYLVSIFQKQVLMNRHQLELYQDTPFPQLNISTLEDYWLEAAGISFNPFLYNSFEMLDIVSTCAPVFPRSSLESCRQCFQIRRKGVQSYGAAASIKISCDKAVLGYFDQVAIFPVPTDYEELLQFVNPKGVIIDDVEELVQPGIYHGLFVHVNRVKYEVSDTETECRPDKTGEIFRSNCLLNCGHQLFANSCSCKALAMQKIGGDVNENVHADVLNETQLCNRFHMSSCVLRDDGKWWTAIENEEDRICRPRCARHQNKCKLPRWDFTLAKTMNKVDLNPVLNEHNSFVAPLVVTVIFNTQQNMKLYLAKSLDDYLADLGGIIGLYFGFSVICVFHMAFYCIYMYMRARAKRKFGNVTSKFRENQTTLSALQQMRKTTVDDTMPGQTDILLRQNDLDRNQPV